MSLYDYETGLKISVKDYPFYALIQACMRQADSYNIIKLRHAFPEVYEELSRRYNARGGILPSDEEEELHMRIVSTPAPRHKEDW